MDDKRGGKKKREKATSANEFRVDCVSKKIGRERGKMKGRGETRVRKCYRCGRCGGLVQEKKEIKVGRDAKPMQMHMHQMQFTDIAANTLLRLPFFFFFFYDSLRYLVFPDRI